MFFNRRDKTCGKTWPFAQRREHGHKSAFVTYKMLGEIMSSKKKSSWLQAKGWPKISISQNQLIFD